MMKNIMDSDMFRGPGPSEVRLSNPPLAKVLCQITFPVIISVENKVFIAPFHNAIRREYPLLTKEQGFEISLSKQGGEVQEKIIWRMEDESKTWRISLGENFIALETSMYSGRGDFLKVLSFVLQNAYEHLNPGTVERIGLRYINRLPFSGVKELSRLMKPKAMGIMSESVESITDSFFAELQLRADEHIKVVGRWGTMPENNSIDPTILKPVDYRSWIIDLDAVTFQKIPFDSEQICEVAHRLGDLDYRFFRFLITDAFLTNFGGTV